MICLPFDVIVVCDVAGRKGGVLGGDTLDAEGLTLDILAHHQLLIQVIWTKGVIGEHRERKKRA